MWSLFLLLPWVFLLGLLLLPANRRWRAWMVLAPPILVHALLYVAGFALSLLPGGLQVFAEQMLTLPALALSAVWLVSHRLARVGRGGAFVLTLLVMGVMAALALATSGAASSGMLIASLIVGGSGLASLTIGFAFAGWRSQERFAPWTFAAWLLLGLLLASMLFATGLSAVVAATTAGAGMVMPIWVLGILISGGVYGFALFAIVAPFLVLAFRNSLYRERFHGVFRFERRAPTLAEREDEQ